MSPSAATIRTGTAIRARSRGRRRRPRRGLHHQVPGRNVVAGERLLHHRPDHGTHLLLARLGEMYSAMIRPHHPCALGPRHRPPPVDVVAPVTDPGGRQGEHDRAIRRGWFAAKYCAIIPP